jgi:hypothetical protein
MTRERVSANGKWALNEVMESTYVQYNDLQLQLVYSIAAPVYVQPI